MNYALVFAGGVGKRMKVESIPKQFMEIQGKPILIHTVEHFEKHEQIDAICVVCVADWIAYTQQLLAKYHIQKVRWLVGGGTSALESQYNGLKAIYASGECQQDDCVLIHDGVRPIINEKLISDCIAAVEQYGAAVTVAPAIETIIQTDGTSSVNRTIARSECMLARAPQAFRIGKILEIHNRAILRGEHDFIDSVSMMLHYGEEIKTVLGPAENIKVTTPADYYTCRALLHAHNELCACD